MKLVTTSLAVGALVIALGGAAFAQTSLDPNAQSGASGKAGTKTHDRAKSGTSGSGTTGAGTQQPGSSGVGASSGVGGPSGGAAGTGTGTSGKPRGTGTMGN
jgi:hypothetical protein